MEMLLLRQSLKLFYLQKAIDDEVSQYAVFHKILLEYAKDNGFKCNHQSNHLDTRCKNCGEVLTDTPILFDDTLECIECSVNLIEDVDDKGRVKHLKRCSNYKSKKYYQDIDKEIELDKLKN